MPNHLGECSSFLMPDISGWRSYKLDTECFSINSDMSTLISALSSSNTNSASALVSSVFPTPVGPKNINEPIGLFGSESPLDTFL